MKWYQAFALLAFCILGAASAQTPAPRVRGFFAHIDDACREHCNNDAACVAKCPQHELTHEELQEIMKEQQQKKEQSR